MASNLDRLSQTLQNTPTVSKDPVADRLDKTNNRLDEMVDLQEDIKDLLGKNGGGAGKEDQLKRVKESTGKSSITRVSGENAGEILRTATENLADNLEKFSKEEHDFIKEMIKKIGDLTEKNLQEYNKKSKELLDFLKKGQALAEKSGNKDLQKRLQDTEGQTREQLYKANKMGLRGSKDTFVNRFAQTFNLKNEKGTSSEFADAKMGFKDKAKAFGTALKVGAKEFGGGFKTGIKYGAKGGLREAVTMSDEQKTRQFEKDNNLSKHVLGFNELDEKDKQTLASRGVAPKSEKDIAYRKDGKPVSKADINAELAKDHEEKNATTAIVPEQQAKPEQVSAAIEKSSDAGASASSLQEEAAGLSEDPIVDALGEQTKKLNEISSTLSQANELFEAIQKAVEKIADSAGSDSGDDSSSASPGSSLLDTASDLVGNRRSRGNSRQSRSERARAQPRDARGRFVKRGSPNAVTPRGRMGGRGRGLVGLGLGLTGAVGLGVAMNDNDGGTADVAANTAMTAADLAPSPTDAVKTEAKATEKAGVKGAEKAGVKGAEKAAAKGVGKVGAKGAAKVGAKALGKSLLKKIPGVGLLAGGVFAAQRAMSGDWKGAGLELASGAASTIPGVGTAASVGIDAALAARDMGAFDGASGAAGGSGGAGGSGSGPMKQGPGKPAQGKSGGIFSKVGGFIKKNPLLAAGALGGVGLAAVGAKKAWDYFSGGSEEAAVQSGQNPDSAILEQGSEKARDKMNVNVPPPTVIQAPGQPVASTSEGSTPKMRGYVRDDESSWMRFALKRTMA